MVFQGVYKGYGCLKKCSCNQEFSSSVGCFGGLFRAGLEAVSWESTVPSTLQGLLLPPVHLAGT